MHRLRFRHVHLDFHTSPAIPGIGQCFSREAWQEALRRGHVNSINLFAKCHHGWSYHPTDVGQQHPHLDFDLLGAQIEACKAMDVTTPLYISAGVDNVASHEHPEWREVGADGRYNGWARDITAAGFHKMCFNSPYLDYLCAQIREVAARFPGADGIWLDIISQGPCCCRWCLQSMAAAGLDAANEADRRTCADQVLEQYYQRTTEAARADRQDMPVFHNSGHIRRGERRRLKYFSHLELESLPTGGWGYDHFPLSAKYCGTLPLDFLGMTGKFHTTWGEFGGYKHPNALRYECAAMLAYGAKCCVGDQLHPEGEMDPTTYDLIGRAYAEVEAKEPWCDNVESVADIGLLSCIAVNGHSGPGRGGDEPDVGATRALLESHLLFDVLDADADFSPYRLLILPDLVRVDDELKSRLDTYLEAGGKLLLTGRSGLAKDGRGYCFDVGAEWCGESEFSPDFVLPLPDLRPDWLNRPLVMYARSQRLTPTTGESLGDVYDPYFNRDFRHFCSHQHAPPNPQASGYACGVQHGNIMLLAHPVFTLYHGMGVVACRDYVKRSLLRLLGTPTVSAGLPSTGRVTLMHQPAARRYVLHLLHAGTIARGGDIALGEGAARRGYRVEVVEDLVPLQNTKVQLRLPESIRRVSLEPQGEEVPVAFTDDGVAFTVDTFSCHQMVALSYA